jgi:putative PIN family toxin of toxin-antitoxin system
MTLGSYKVVFDTNILISGHFWKGPPYRCLLAVESGLATLILSDPILTEFREKLTDKFGLSKSDVTPIVERWATRAQLASIEGKSGWVAEDPDDDKFIETALAGGATIIVSGDRHLLSLGKVQGIEILTARQFLDRLAIADTEM